MKDFRRIKDLSEQEKPYEKCEIYGVEHLTDTELLAILLRTGTKGSSALALAGELLEPKGKKRGLTGLYQMSCEELKEIPGIGKVKAIQIKCLLELSRRIAKESSKSRLIFSNPAAIADYYMEDFRHCEQEQMILLMLNTKGVFLGDAMISRGTVNAALISPREIFLKALSYHAVSVVLMHNHPSGDPSPSEEDVFLTARIQKAGELIGIELLDHLILGDRRFFSFKEQGIF